MKYGDTFLIPVSSDPEYGNSIPQRTRNSREKSCLESIIIKSISREAQKYKKEYQQTQSNIKYTCSFNYSY